MELSELIKPAREKLDLAPFYPGEWVTLRMYPRVMRGMITQAQIKDIDMGKVREIALESGKEKVDEDAFNVIWNSGRISELYKPGWDGGVELKTLSLEAGIDPKEHSITVDGNPAVLDRKFFEGMIETRPGFTDWLYAQVERFQKAHGLGK